MEFRRFDGEWVMETVHVEGMSCTKGEKHEAAWDVYETSGVLICLKYRVIRDEKFGWVWKLN